MQTFNSSVCSLRLLILLWHWLACMWWWWTWFSVINDCFTDSRNKLIWMGKWLHRCRRCSCRAWHFILQCWVGLYNSVEISWQYGRDSNMNYEFGLEKLKPFKTNKSSLLWSSSLKLMCVWYCTWRNRATISWWNSNWRWRRLASKLLLNWLLWRLDWLE